MHANRTILVLAPGALAAAVLLAGCGSTKSKAASPHVLRYLAVDQSGTAIGFGDKRPPRVGDRFMFTNALYKPGARPDTPSGKPVGHGEALCTFTAPRLGKFFCSGTIHLAGGYIAIFNDVRGNERLNTGVVVGGVGAYANARGTTEFTVLKRTREGQETSAIVVRLTP